MTYFTGLRCVHCGRTYNTDEVEYYCASCGYHDGILDVLYDYDAMRKELNPASLAANSDRSMWRYLPLLPVADRTLIPHLQVGWTPLYDAPRVAGELGVARCWVKDEGRNPTASFKDRASAMGVVKALEKNASRITCASTGNAASSLAGFAAAAGIPASIFVPARAPEAKVAQLLIYGAQVFSVQGTYDEAWELCMLAAAEFGWYNRNCAINPYLIEGKKTVSLELAEQFGTLTPGSFPDWVVVSVGDGCTIGGVWKGLREMHTLGFIPQLPRRSRRLPALGTPPFRPQAAGRRVRRRLRRRDTSVYPHVGAQSGRLWRASGCCRRSGSQAGGGVWNNSSFGICRDHHDWQWTERYSKRNSRRGAHDCRATRDGRSSQSSKSRDYSLMALSAQRNESEKGSR